MYLYMTDHSTGGALKALVDALGYPGEVPR